MIVPQERTQNNFPSSSWLETHCFLTLFFDAPINRVGLTYHTSRMNHRGWNLGRVESKYEIYTKDIQYISIYIYMYIYTKCLLTINPSKLSQTPFWDREAASPGDFIKFGFSLGNRFVFVVLFCICFISRFHPSLDSTPL